MPSQESNFLLERLIDLGIISDRVIRKNVMFYFAHRLTEHELLEVKYNKFNREFDRIRPKLKENNWELHKKLINEGVNPNEIAKIIRNDEIEKLQEISSQQKFNFNQTIEPSLYEICSFVNQDNVTLIDYAAFFGSIKCFKYLLMNGANVINAFKYAVVGGNLEIIHLCEQNKSSYDGVYKAAIEYHRNDIFKYIYENQGPKYYSLEKLGEICILYANYNIFMLLIDEGMKINENIFKELIKFGNIFLIYNFVKTKLDAKYPSRSTLSEKDELDNDILEKFEVDLNYKDFCYFH